MATKKKNYDHIPDTKAAEAMRARDENQSAASKVSLDGLKNPNAPNYSTMPEVANRLGAMPPPTASTTNPDRASSHSMSSEFNFLDNWNQLNKYSPTYQGTDIAFPSFSYGNAPTYTSPYGKYADGVLQKILNREDFQYNPQSDAMYKYYADNYTRLGQQAMADTIGNAALLTGGYGNSYGVTAGQQAYNQYMQDLANIVPQLEQQAYDRYRAEADDLYNQYQAIMQAENNAYGMHRDAVSDYFNARDFAYGQVQDQIAHNKWLAQFNRQVEESDRAYNRSVLEYNTELGMAVESTQEQSDPVENFAPKEAYDFIDKYGHLINSDAEYVESLYQSFGHQDGFFDWAARQQLADGRLMSDLLIELNPDTKEMFEELYGNVDTDYSHIPDTKAAEAMKDRDKKKKALLQ